MWGSLVHGYVETSNISSMSNFIAIVCGSFNVTDSAITCFGMQWRKTVSRSLHGGPARRNGSSELM